MQWNIDEHGTLRFDGMYVKPVNPKHLATIEAAYQRVKRQAAEYGQGVRIIGIQVEKHCLTGLFDNGDITPEAMERAVSVDDSLMVPVEVDGETTWLEILPHMTHHDSYQFVVRGHPRGIEVVRDDLELEA